MATKPSGPRADISKIEITAMVCHEVNRAYCESIGDNSQVPWEQAPDWQKDSAKEGVFNTFTGRITSPRESHTLWMAKKEAEGWKYGPVKNVETKEHPCLVPYDELPNSQRAKDAIFYAICKFMKDPDLTLKFIK
jgi:hypothetical protein